MSTNTGGKLFALQFYVQFDGAMRETQVLNSSAAGGKDLKENWRTQGTNHAILLIYGCNTVAASGGWRRLLVSSGSAALDEARVEADVSDVVSVEQPGEEALQAQAVAAVGARAVLPLEHTRRRTGSLSRHQYFKALLKEIFLKI